MTKTLGPALALATLLGAVSCQRCGSTQTDSGGSAQRGSDGAKQTDSDAVWTFPAQGQAEPPLRDSSGQEYPAERAEPHLVASDGTTFVERWFPPRIQCLDGATGRVRWEHAMPPVAAPQGGGATPSVLWTGGPILQAPGCCPAAARNSASSGHVAGGGGGNLAASAAFSCDLSPSSCV